LRDSAGFAPDFAGPRGARRRRRARRVYDRLRPYFGYTLGKLEILALRDLAGGDLRAFHDRLLTNGTPPPAIAARHLLAA
jgi:hypothetical protein